MLQSLQSIRLRDKIETVKNNGSTNRGNVRSAGHLDALKQAMPRLDEGPGLRERDQDMAKAKWRSPGAPLKERIVGTLKAKLGKSYGNISVWFHTTARGMKEIKKVEPGRFAWAS